MFLNMRIISSKSPFLSACSGDDLQLNSGSVLDSKSRITACMRVLIVLIVRRKSTYVDETSVRISDSARDRNTRVKNNSYGDF